MLNERPRSLFKSVAIASAGSGVEMYDFVTYIFFAPIIAKQFFPFSSYLVSLLFTFGAFAIGFYFRTLGAIFFGFLGDTKGRKKTLIYTIIVMTIPTILLTFLPTYNYIGIWAPIILTVLRCIQGLAVGGEFSDSLTLVAEYSDPKKRGLFCSLIILALNLGILLSLCISMIITIAMINKGMLWSWRIVFFLGCFPAVLITYIRRNLDESPIFEEFSKKKESFHAPMFELFFASIEKTIFLLCMTVGPALVVGKIMFLHTYLKHFTLLNDSFSVLIYSCFSLLIVCITLPLFGKLSDIIGRKPVFICGLVSTAFFIYPIARWLSTETDFYTMFWPLLFISIPDSLVLSVFGSFLAENFPTRYRASGIGVVYSIPLALITGTFPVISLAIYNFAHSLSFQYGYIIILALFSLVFVIFSKETAGKVLPE